MSKKDINREGAGKHEKSTGSDEFPIQEYKLVPIDHVEKKVPENEIDLIQLFKTIWESRKVIYKFITIGFVLGILVVLLSPKEYVSSATLMPEYATEGNLGGASSLLKQFGGAFGISGGTYSSNSNAIRVDLYPKIVRSLSFQDKLARQEFYFSKYDTTASIYEYYFDIKELGFLGYLKKYTIRLPGIIVGFFLQQEESVVANTANEESDIVELSQGEMKIIGLLRQKVYASFNTESGIVTVNARMSDPKLAANVAKYTIDELTAYLIDYRTEKATKNLEFVREQMEEARNRFVQAQLARAEYEDSNLGSQTAKANTERQRLESEYNLAFNLYSSLSQQYEEAKIKVQEDTPVFKVLQPVQVPVNDEMDGMVVLAFITFISVIIGIGWIFVKAFLEKHL